MTTLSDDRVERMRAAVLDTVRTDVHRRGRRGRRVLGGLAAASVVVVVGGLGFTAVDLGAGGGGGGAESSSAADVAAEPAPGVAEPAPDGGGVGFSAGSGLESSGDPERLDEDLSAREPDGGFSFTAGPQDRQGRDVVTTGTVTVRVDDARRAADELATFVDGLEGRVDDRTEVDSGRDTSATLVVRVPAGQVDRTITELRTYGDVTGVDVSREDVTAVRTDLEARIRSLTVSVERLRDIAAGARTTNGLLRVEEALSSRQAELESLQSQRETLVGQVALSTLTVDLVPTDRAETVEPGGFTGGLTTGWNGLVKAVNAGVHVAGVLAPWLGVALVGWLLWRPLRRRRT